MDSDLHFFFFAVARGCALFRGLPRPGRGLATDRYRHQDPCFGEERLAAPRRRARVTNVNVTMVDVMFEEIGRLVGGLPAWAASRRRLVGN